LGGPGEEFIGGCGWSVHACKKADAVHRPVAEMLAQPCSLAVDCSVAQTIRPKKKLGPPNCPSSEPPIHDSTPPGHRTPAPSGPTSHGAETPTCTDLCCANFDVLACEGVVTVAQRLNSPQDRATGPLARHNAFT
jgi:hypothetical protein